MEFKHLHSGKETNIFTEINSLVQKFNAVDLSQGSPDYPMDPRLRDYLVEAAHIDLYTYSCIPSLPYFTENIINFNKNRPHPIQLTDAELTTVPGATYAMYVSFTTFIEPGDEVIVFEPCYDTYIPAIEIRRAKPVYVSLDENFEVDWNLLQEAISSKTRAVIVNSPHNPTGKMWTSSDWNQLWELIKDFDIVVISDEVYDLTCYDGKTFLSAYHHEGIRERCFCIYSFEKMFHIAGWKASYVVASEKCTAAFRRVHQYLTFTINFYSQHTMARYLEVFDLHQHQNQLESKRDLLLGELANCPLKPIGKCEGGLFQTFSFLQWDSTLSDSDFALQLIADAKVATVPYSAFYHDGRNTGNIRLCFAKKDETILQAAENLRNYLT